MSTNPEMRSLLPEMKSALDSFLSTKSAFHIVRTVPVHLSIPSQSSPSQPKRAVNAQPKTLFILDSSFNPPQIAHLTLATSALKASIDRYPLPHRLLLLFSTFNADKSPAPAAFEHRLAMMTLFAEDMFEGIAQTRSSDSNNNDSPAGEELVCIDVGLTSQPYYNDKSSAIDESAVYSSNPKHIHLAGFDTFTRIFTPKYYPNSDPPLAVLAPFFEKHGLRITIRPAEGGKDEWGSVADQRRYLEGIGKGEMEEMGGKRQWADAIEMVQAEREALGVSSTKIREAVVAREWSVVRKLCTPRVEKWIKEHGLYSGEAGGGKEKM